MLKIPFYLAVVCLVASVVVHVSTFFGVNPQRVFPAVWVLHALVFVVWFPVVLSCQRACKGHYAKDFWRIAMRYAPTWMKSLSVVLFAYGFVNFFITFLVLGEGGVPVESGVRKTLESHGTVIRELTDEEFELHEAYGLRGFSGHWMIFYSIGMTVLCSRLRDDAAELPEPAE